MSKASPSATRASPSPTTSRAPILLLLLLLLPTTIAFIFPPRASLGSKLAVSSRIPGSQSTSRGMPVGRTRQDRGHVRYSSTTSSSSSGSEGAGAGGASKAPIEFQDDFKRMVEEGVPINLSAILSKADTLHNEHGTVFLEAFKRTPSSSFSSSTTSKNALQRFLKLGHKKPTPDGLPEIESGRWWRWTPAEQREFLEVVEGPAAPPPASAPSSSASSLPHMQKVIKNPATNPPPIAPPCYFRLRHPFPFHALTTRLAYHPSTGRFTLAETPWLEKNELYRWSLPFFLRVLLKLARPAYAPLFCLKWVGLRAMILWRSFSQFIFPSAPYVTLFAFRAIYMLAACALVTVALDELMRPAFQWAFQKVFGGERPYPDLNFYDLAEAGRKGKKGVEMGGGGAGGLSWRDRLFAL